ncbi:MAG: hypothetical protein J7494_07880 [Sphingobium sp.]|nr:hypothetical protein [Sphingobium sp.]
MSISIGDGSLPPVYPTQPSDPGSGDGESSGSTENASSGGGPDAVYEPSVPEEDGEPLTYSFPQGTASSGAGEEEQSGDAGLDDAESAGDGGIDPYADGAAGERGTDPAAGASSGEGSSDPYADYSATDGGDGSYDYGAYGDGSDGSSDGGSVDPEAGISEQGDDAGPGQPGDEPGPVPVAAQPVAQDHISATAHKAAVAQAAAAAEVSRPSLASALGQGQGHGSLASQMGKASSETGAALASVQPAYAPAHAVRQTRTLAPQQAGKLLAAVQDAAAPAQAEAPKVRASVVAQAAYAMVGDARRIDRSMLSLIDKLG